MSHVRSLYRKIFRIAKTWKPIEDREYIYSEARRLFRKNQDLTCHSEIENKIFECESRIELALHYNIPYPRASNVGPGTTGRNTHVVNLAYMDSYDGSAVTKNNGEKRMGKLPIF